MAGNDGLRRALRHDVRAPLAVVLGRCEMLLDADEALGPLTDAQRRAIEAIMRSGETLRDQLDRVANQILGSEQP